MLIYNDVEGQIRNQAETTLLDTLELTGSASRSIFMSNVKQILENWTSRTLAAVEALIKVTQEEEVKELDEPIDKLDGAENNKAAKRRAEKISK